MTPPDPNPDGVNGDWITWRRYVIEELKRLAIGQELLHKSVNDVHVQLAVIQTKLWAWALLFGFAAGLVAQVVGSRLGKFGLTIAVMTATWW